MYFLLLVLLIVIFYLLYKNKVIQSKILYAVFVILWIVIFMPHVIHYVNVQL